MNENQSYNIISKHEVIIYRWLREHPETWFECWEVAKLTGVGKRTVAKHVVRFVALGFIEQGELFPSYCYRWLESAENQAYIARLEKAVDILKNKLNEDLGRP